MDDPASSVPTAAPGPAGSPSAGAGEPAAPGPRGAEPPDRGLPLLFGYDVFVSYTHRDGRAYALALARRLREELGYTVFLDTDDLVEGDELRPSIQRALLRSRMLVVLWTARAPESRWIPVERALYRSRRPKAAVLQIVLGGPRGDEEHLWLDEGGPRDAPSDAVLAGFRRRLARGRSRQLARAVLAALGALGLGVSLAGGVAAAAWQRAEEEAWFPVPTEYPVVGPVALRQRGSAAPTLRYRSSASFAQNDEDQAGHIRFVEADLGGRALGCVALPYDTTEGFRAGGADCSGGGPAPGLEGLTRRLDPADADSPIVVELLEWGDHLRPEDEPAAPPAEVEAERWFLGGDPEPRAVAVLDREEGVSFQQFERGRASWESPPLPWAHASQVGGVVVHGAELRVGLMSHPIPDEPAAPAGLWGWRVGEAAWAPVPLPEGYAGRSIADLVARDGVYAIVFAARSDRSLAPPPGVPGIVVWGGSAVRALPALAEGPPSGGRLVGITAAGEVLVQLGEKEGAELLLHRRATVAERVAAGLRWGP